MGIIIKQSIKGSIWSYLGVVIGFVTTSYLFPNFLTTDTVGLFGLLLAWSLLFAQFSSFGLHGVTSRLFPFFRDKSKNHNGYLFIAFMTMLIGFILFVIFFLSLKTWFIESNIEKSKLFADYIYLLLPLTFFTLLFIQLDIFNKVLYDAVFGTFLQEFFQRILILLITILYAFSLVDLPRFILLYVASVCAKGIVIFIYLIIKGEISFRPQLNFIDVKLRKEMIDVAVFNVLTGLGGSIIFNIDKVIINQMLGLSATGVYTIAFFFGTLVVIPSRPLLRISGTLIADAFKRNDLEYISDIYRRSCINQFIIGAFLFGGIWINIENILIILGPDYITAKWVIFFVGIGYLIEMATGANGHIIAFSEHYRVALYFLIILISFLVVAMYYFIPAWGIAGAAFASALSLSVNNFMRFVYLKRKYKMQPFNFKFILVIISFLTAYFFVIIMPNFNLLVDIIFKSTVFTIIFATQILIYNVSTDVRSLFLKIIRRS